MSSSNITLLFIDTEFTSLGGDDGAPEFISIGAVDYASGRHFYAESLDFDPSKMSEFTQGHVAPLLQRGEYALDFEEVAARFFEFIASFDSQVILAMDSSWDWQWVRYLAEPWGCMDRPLRDLPQEAPLWPSNLMLEPFMCAWSGLTAARRSEAKAARYSYFSKESKIAHHALSDSYAALYAFKAALGPLFDQSEINPRNLARFEKMFREVPFVPGGTLPPFT